MTMNSKLATLALFSILGASAAQADCPEIEGRYSYTCTIQHDDEADLGKLLESSGQAVVDQLGCDLYDFIETVKGNDSIFDLGNRDSRHHEYSTKIKKSSSRKLRFRIARAPEGDLGENLAAFIMGETFVTKATIRKTRFGFVLKGKEKSKYLGVLTNNHSKFSCRFERI
jgi:hypothetical protein